MSEEQRIDAGGPAHGIEVRGLVVRYRRGFWLRRHAALDGIDLALRRGGTHGLIGPNGSGKSTLMRVLAGIEPGTSGSARLLGEPAGADRLRARVGYLSEGTSFPPELGPESLLDLLDRAHGGPSADRRERIGGWLERVGLSDARRVPLAKFSSGMRRRFGLAAACMHSPEVLLLDEPSLGLDAEGAVLLQSLLAEARGRGSTVLVCSHLPSDLFSACESVTVLRAGRVSAQAPPEALARRVERLELEVEQREGLDLAAVARALSGEGLELLGARPSAASLEALYAALADGADREDRP